MEPTPDDALLTAYLDGELTPEERQSLEQRLADEPELRYRLTLLEETWCYLDLLEQDGADAEQIEKTLNTAAVSLSVLPVLPLRANRWRGWSIGVLAGLALFALTFYVGSRTPAGDLSLRRIEAEKKQLAEALESLSHWDKEELLNEEPKVIIDILKELWNAH